MNSKERNFLRKLAHNIDVNIRIGKEGINENVLENIKQYIDKNEMVKIKLMQNSLEDITSELIFEIEKYTKAVFVASIGKTMIFFKEYRKKGKIGEITQKYIEYKKSRVKV